MPITQLLTDPVWWFFLIWLPDFFRQTRGLEIKRSWVHLVTIYGIITVLSIGGGWITDFLTGKGWTVIYLVAFRLNHLCAPRFEPLPPQR